MQQHQPSPSSRHAALLTTLTIDMSHALRTLNSNTWKNSSGKLMNRTNADKAKLTGRENRENLVMGMTEQDIDKLFKREKTDHKEREHSKEAECRKQRMMTCDHQARDFVRSVKFLKADDETDRLLGGLPTLPSLLDQNCISLLFDSNPSDLTAEFKKNYMVGKIIGEGAYASVRVAIYKPTNKKVAIKVYQKSKIKDPQRKKSVRRQIRILQLLDHPNIVAIHDVVQTNNHLNIIMEYLSGISLGTYIKSQNNHRASEKNAKIVMRGIVEGLAYLHGMMIAHRDVKLENIILGEDLTPKLIDFGFSTCIEKYKKVKIFCGTPSYMAPEIVQKKEYRGQPADIWALGVLFFVTITGIFPFKGATDQELYKKINSADYSKSELFFSKDVTDLIGRMLKVAPEQRITAKQVLLNIFQMLAHPWFKAGQSSDLKKKHEKKNTEASQCRKRTTTSSHKSKEKTLNQTGNLRKLTETCKDANLKLELRNIRQSPLKLNSTFTHRKLNKELQKMIPPPSKLESGLLANFKKQLREKDKIYIKESKQKDVMKQIDFYKEKQARDRQKQILNKTNSKVVELLKMGLKRKIEDKPKGKIKRS